MKFQDPYYIKTKAVIRAFSKVIKFAQFRQNSFNLMPQSSQITDVIIHTWDFAMQ